MLKWLREYYVEITGLLVLLGFLYLIMFGIDTIAQLSWPDAWSLPEMPLKVQTVATIFLSIFIEGIPFILIGVLVSSLIHIYVNEEMVWRWVPKNPLLSIPFASCLGLLLPVCECGVVPVSKRLIQKGLPPYIAFTFLLAAPVINPVTIVSTYIAFGNAWDMTLARLLLAAFVAWVMGVLFFWFFKRDVLKPEVSKVHTDQCDHDHDHNHDHNHDHDHHHDCHDHSGIKKDRFGHALYHSVFEFMDMGKYFVMGALIAASFQTFVGMGAIRDFAENEWLAILLMMGLAFGMSLCSSADAFVAASFRTAMGPAPLLAFMVYGPMLDLKNVLMMSGTFKRSVMLFFIVASTLLTLVAIGLYILMGF
ncbi:permease [Desmospora activa]|uniref:Permease n=1 Tax=Desmospora activa DSM 45169 TaxID=1121389 RepID=A0A2T4Z6W1_9BACL|nr:permease [Desmospora activa]PTM57618.1 hypothetical protein C8J48_0168 [Desmospora activa DSM 45169]